MDHSILLMKLRTVSLGDDILRWFNSYHTDKQQLVDVSGTHSCSVPSSCGVPQGSIIGTLLFLIIRCGMLVSGKCKAEIERL